jgi:hypothetical protein
MRRWTRGQRCLCCPGVILLVLALERLANAALLGGRSGASIALGFSFALGVLGALTLTGVLVLPSIRRGALRLRKQGVALPNDRDMTSRKHGDAPIHCTSPSRHVDVVQTVADEAMVVSRKASPSPALQG